MLPVALLAMRLHADVVHQEHFDMAEAQALQAILV